MKDEALNHDFNTCAACQKAAQEAEKLRIELQGQLYGFEHPHHFFNKISKCQVHLAQSKNPGK
jgi:hypothetical protein